ncbi:MAG: hypothetical protein ACKOET_17475 [Verrucomicrobiota bacterium]
MSPGQDFLLPAGLPPPAGWRSARPTPSRPAHLKPGIDPRTLRRPGPRCRNVLTLLWLALARGVIAGTPATAGGAFEFLSRVASVNPR